MTQWCPICTGVHYDAMVPPKWKAGLIKCFLHRADVICSNDTNHNDEINTLKDIFSRNGYPTQFFDKVKIDFHNKKKEIESRKSQGSDKSPNKAANKEQAGKYISTVKIPYLGKISELFGRRLKKIMKTVEQDIRIVYETSRVCDAFQLKDAVPKELQAKVVYEFTCRGDPDVKYIGYTNRTLKERYREHVRGGSAISDHIAQCNACATKGVTLDDFRVLKRCRYKRDTPKFEALLIKEKDPSLNRQLVKPGGKQYSLAIF